VFWDQKGVHTDLRLNILRKLRRSKCQCKSC